MAGKRPGRQSLCRTQHPVVQNGQTKGPWGPLGLQREALAVSAVNIDGYGHCRAKVLRASLGDDAEGTLQKIHGILSLFLTAESGEGKETHPLGLTGQQEGLSCDERKNFLQGKVIKPWSELLREMMEVTS